MILIDRPVSNWALQPSNGITYEFSSILVKKIYIVVRAANGYK